MSKQRQKMCAAAVWLFFVITAVCGCRAAGQNTLDAAGQNTADVTEETEIQAPAAEAEEMPYPVMLDAAFAEDIDRAVYSEGIFLIFNGKTYGFMDETGEMVTDAVYEFAYPFSEGLACVKSEGKYGFINASGEAEIPFIYDRANSFSEGLAYFESGDSYGFIGRDGRTAFLLDCDSISSFSEGLAFFCTDGRYGYIDRTGEQGVPPIYDDADYFKDGIARVRKGISFGVIDTLGREVVRAEYDSVDINEQLIVVQSGDRYGCFDKSGREILPLAYDMLSAAGNKIVYKEGGKYGIADLNGSTIAEALYDSVMVIPELGAAIVGQDERFGILGAGGNIVLPVIYEEIFCQGEFPDLVFVVKKEEKYGFFSAEEWTDHGTVDISLCYEEVADYQDGMAAVGRAGKYGVVDLHGNLVLDYAYESIRVFENGMFAVENDETYRLMNSEGAVYGEETYDRILQYGECYEIEKDGAYGFLNRAGEEIIPAIYDIISYDETCGASDCYVPCVLNDKNTHIIMTGKPESGDLSAMLFRNEITPRISQFHELTESGEISVDDPESSHSIPVKLLYSQELTVRLYRIDGESSPVMYIYAEPYTKLNFPLSHSAFFGLKDGRAQQLLSGYQCGGSMGGEFVHLWSDREENSVQIGATGKFGGFGGHSFTYEIYRCEDGKIEVENRFSFVDVKKEDYLGSMLEQPELLFDEQGNPYTKESIQGAEYICEYQINDETVTLETYDELFRRYRLCYFVY